MGFVDSRPEAYKSRALPTRRAQIPRSTDQTRTNPALYRPDAHKFRALPTWGTLGIMGETAPLTEQGETPCNYGNPCIIGFRFAWYSKTWPCDRGSTELQGCALLV